MCEMQKMPTREDASCEEDSDMNFTFSAAGAAGTHYVTAGGQVAKLQQNVANNGTTLSQVVGMVGGVSMADGMQYVRTIDSGATMQATPQIISLPITLPGAKPGDPQSTVQIQVLNPNLIQQQPKYQMQIPIQGFQQAGGMITLAYSPESNETGGIQLLGNSLPEGIQVLAALPQDMQLMQAAQTEDNKEALQSNLHQVFITQNQQIVINGADDLTKSLKTHNPNVTNVVIKEEENEEYMDDESSQETEPGDSSYQVYQHQQAIVNYLNTLPPQHAQSLPPSLQQFLKLNTTEIKKPIEIEVPAMDEDKKDATEAIINEDGSIKIQNKKKKKYRKKPTKPARPKPGQVVITQSSDGTPIYCCPVCEMAYTEKEDLETHLGVHKIERRFICGICGAGLKRKEHLERHKLGHNPDRPYVCGLCRKGFKRREHLNLHTVIHSGVKNEVCGFCGKGFYRKDHLRKHTRSHERRQREEAAADPSTPSLQPSLNPGLPTPSPTDGALNDTGGIMPEITIHVPTSANMNVPVQINIPQHIVSSLAAAQKAQAEAQAQHAQAQAQHAQAQAQAQAQQAQAQAQAQQAQDASDAQSTLDALFANNS